MAPRGVLKTHLKREDRVKALAKRSVENIKKKLEDYDPSAGTPPQMRAVTQPILEKANTWKHQVLTGNDVIQDFLQLLPDEKLRDLRHIFSVKGAGINTERKILASSYVLMEDVHVVDKCVDHLHRVKAEVISSYTEMYAFSYNVERATNDVQFDNEKFLTVLDKVADFRRGLRQATEALSNNSNNLINDEDNSESNRCCLM